MRERSLPSVPAAVSWPAPRKQAVVTARRYLACASRMRRRGKDDGEEEEDEEEDEEAVGEVSSSTKAGQGTDTAPWAACA